MESIDPVVSLAQFSPASPVNLPASQSIFPGLHEVSGPAPAPGWDGDELAQLLLSRNFQVIQLANGTVVASDESGAAVFREPFEEQEMEVARVRSLVLDGPAQTTSDAREMTGLNPVAMLDEQGTVSMGPEENSRSAEPALEPEPAAREAVPDSAPAGSDRPGDQVENQPEVVQSLLEAWGIPVEEAWEGVSPDQWQVVPDPGQSSGNLPVEQPPEEAEKPAQTNEVTNHPNLTDIRKLSMRRETPEETAETPVQTAPEAPPAQVDPEMEEGSLLQPDLLCQLQGSTPAARAIPIIDSLMEEDFRQKGWTLRSDLKDGMAAESDARAMRNQPFTLWLSLTGLAVLVLLGFLLRRREPAAVVLEKGSEERS